MSRLPTIVHNVEEGHPLCKSRRMVGKTVQNIRFGIGKSIKDVHRSEVLLIEFTDGEILGIDTGSNLNPADPLWHSGIKPDDVQIDLMLTWKPETP